MSKSYLKSVLEQISETVFKLKDLSEAKLYIRSFISSKQINETDKLLIIKNTNESKSITALQRYICMSLLKYEGLGMNNFNKTSRQAASETEYE